jgi:hypothetical protein
MFDTTSRYYSLETAIFTTATGAEVVYKRRRFLPLVETNVVLAEHTVTQGERLDHITARYLGDSELFWQLADVNNAMRPEELTVDIGRKLRVSFPSIGL